jgi:hypothetical protein
MLDEGLFWHDNGLVLLLKKAGAKRANSLGRRSFFGLWAAP